MPAHPQKGNTPYDYLKTTQVDDLTQDQINDSIKESFVPEQRQGKQIIQIHKVKEASSTFGSNGVIPSKGTIAQVAFTDAPPTGTAIQPSAGEVWKLDLTDINIVNGSSSTNNVTLQWSDANNVQCTIVTTGISGAATAGALFDIEKTPSKIVYLTNSLYLSVVGSQSDESTIKVPYQMVAM